VRLNDIKMNYAAGGETQQVSLAPVVVARSYDRVFSKVAA